MLQSLWCGNRYGRMPLSIRRIQLYIRGKVNSAKKSDRGVISRVLCEAVIYLAAALPQSVPSNLPAGIGRAARLLLGLAPGKVCHAPEITLRPVGSYPTFSPLPDHTIADRITGRYVFCGTFSPDASSGPGVTRCRALWSPDFPPGRTPRRRPTPRSQKKLGVACYSSSPARSSPSS